MKRFMRKEIFLRFSLSVLLTFVIIFSFSSKSMAAINEHEHQMGNVPMIESILWEEILHHFYYEGPDGRTYDYQEVSQYCYWYYSCYCGYRDNYFYRGRIIYRDVLVSE